MFIFVFFFCGGSAGVWKPFHELVSSIAFVILGTNTHKHQIVNSNDPVSSTSVLSFLPSGFVINTICCP